MTDDDRIPVVVAAGQATERETAMSPLDLAASAGELALSQAPALRGRVGRVSMVNILSGGGSSPAGALATRLGLSPESTEVSTIGGNSPQSLLNRAASAIAAGHVEAVLVAGAETQRSKRLRRAQDAHGTDGTGSGRRESVQPARQEPAQDEGPRAQHPPLPPDPMIGDTRPGAGPAELAAGLIAPVHVYALFESVLAHRAGRSFEAQRAALGELMAPFTEVAAKHPYAWFPQALSPSDISEIGPDNRLVSEPYPKRVCAVMGVDQAAAVLVTSLAAARAAEVADRAVFCWSGAEASDVWFPTARPDLGASPGIAASTSAALSTAGIGVDDISAFDLYSCFPCVVQMGAAALGIDPRDSRGLTVTGGLPYFGGPGNDYTLHAVATMVDQLRERGGTGLVTGLGWYATKHASGVYGATPPPRGWQQGDTAGAQEEIDATAVDVVDLADLDPGTDGGPPASSSPSAPSPHATVLASTVAVGRDGEVASAPVIARLDDGRQLAVAAAEEELASLAGRSLVGERVVISGSPPRFRVAG